MVAYIVVYIVVFLYTFFVACFMVARYADASPMEPSNFLILVGASLIWPITLPLTVVITLLLFVAELATKLSECEE